MPEPYTIKILLPDGNPESVKIVEMLNWTGVCIAIPRRFWEAFRSRTELTRSGVYILSGPAEGTDDDLPTVYVGQGDEVQRRINDHYNDRLFWDWVFVFVSQSNTLNRAHITWLEFSMLRQAQRAGQCHLDNGNIPREPTMSESERADTRAFLREMLRILPLLGVRAFEEPIPVTVTASSREPQQNSPSIAGNKDTVVVPAQIDGFNETFLGQHQWHAIRIGGGMLPRIRFIAAYQTAPVSAVTHVARVERIEPYGDEGKYKLVFAEPATVLERPIPFGDSPQGLMQGPRYTSYSRLQTARKVWELF